MEASGNGQLKKENRQEEETRSCTLGTPYGRGHAERIGHRHQFTEDPPVDSPVYRAIKYLYIDQGLALPSTTGPWTEAELELMLSGIDSAALSEDSKTVYGYVTEELGRHAKLEKGIPGTDISLWMDTDFRAHTNPKDFQDPDMWGGKDEWYEPEPFLKLPLEVWIGSGSYGYFELLQANYRQLRFDRGHGFNDMYWGTNIPALSQHQTAFDTSLDFPNRGFISLGGSWWNLQIGRDRMDWGPGETGNFRIGRHIPYLDSVKFTTFSEKLEFFSRLDFIAVWNRGNRKGASADDLRFSMGLRYTL